MSNLNDIDQFFYKSTSKTYTGIETGRTILVYKILPKKVKIHKKEGAVLSDSLKLTAAY